VLVRIQKDQESDGTIEQTGQISSDWKGAHNQRVLAVAGQLHDALAPSGPRTLVLSGLEEFPKDFGGNAVPDGQSTLHEGDMLADVPPRSRTDVENLSGAGEQDAAQPDGVDGIRQGPKGLAEELLLWSARHRSPPHSCLAGRSWAAASLLSPEHSGAHIVFGVRS
jgi:hypothetical protein